MAAGRCEFAAGKEALASPQARASPGSHPDRDPRGRCKWRSRRYDLDTSARRCHLLAGSAVPGLGGTPNRLEFHWANRPARQPEESQKPEHDYQH